MKNNFKIFFITLLISLFTAFSAFAAGMGVVKSNDHEQVLIYTYDDGTCATNQWKQVWDNWYYFGEDGRSKQNTWAEIDGKWYYFDQWSVMLHDTTTPDGYTVGPDGAWVKDGQVVVEPVAETAANN